MVLWIAWRLVDSGYFTASRPSVVTIERSEAGDRLLVDGKPYLVRGVCYTPIPVGKDYEYNFWGDPARPWITDGALMREAGVNTVRFYRMGKNPAEVRRVLDELYSKFRIRSLAGHYLGFWSWPPPNYADPDFRARVKAEVLEMVRQYKDSPGVIGWILGNENNYSFDGKVQRWSSDAIDAMANHEDQRRERARIYYRFVNDIAVAIRRIDPNHPVILGTGEVKSLDLAKEFAPDIDILGMIAYRGPGFGNLFRQVRQKYDKPVLMIEWGADSYNALRRKPDEKAQAEFVKLQWQDIERNAAGGKGEGNSLGGTIFEWTDEWWKGNENLPRTWSVQDTAAHWNHAAYHYDADVPGGMNMNEEWWGIVRLDPKEDDEAINARVPKKAYKELQDLWTK
ncbi:MAG: hypothetical protein A3D28_03065 [Omnitrophica bacterium RIFCSPHIGHO2_02_FULL_63_14]|nr:MAG: hypothetical protein A3D28_03065 [Omnitrophica bacterium RIFCSPHIGHO2_02_FULL_63_14]